MFDEFTPATAAEWRQKITSELKGKPYEDLVWHTDSGFDLQPFYTDETRQAADDFGTISGNERAWAITTEIPVDTPRNANIKILDALQNGATALVVDATKYESQREFNAAFKDVLPQYIHSFLRTDNVLHTIDLYTKFIKKNNINPDAVQGGFIFNPLKNLDKYNRQELALEDVGVALASIKNYLPSFKLLQISTQNNHQNTAHELADMLHTANQYLQYLTETDGWEIDEITPHIGFEMAINDDFYAQIAKMRAFRLLWANVVQAYKPTQNITQTTHILAITTIDPNEKNDANIVRNTTQSMAAVMGGADALMVLPHTTDHVFGTRIARNVQLIMQHESYMHEVADVVGGAYFIEEFTHKLAMAAWEIFRKM